MFVASQLCGAILAQFLASYVLLNSWYSSMGPGATMPHNDVNLIQASSVVLCVYLYTGAVQTKMILYIFLIESTQNLKDA